MQDLPGFKAHLSRTDDEYAADAAEVTNLASQLREKIIDEGAKPADLYRAAGMHLPTGYDHLRLGQMLAAALVVMAGQHGEVLPAQLRPSVEKADSEEVEALAVLLCSFQVGLWRDGQYVQQGTPAIWWRPQVEEVKQFYREQAEYVLTSLRNRSAA